MFFELFIFCCGLQVLRKVPALGTCKACSCLVGYQTVCIRSLSSHFL